LDPKDIMGSVAPVRSSLGVEGFALVTGAGSGIGRATALLLAREYSAGIAISDINETGILEVKRELVAVATNPSFKCITIVANVADEDSVQNMMAKVVAEFGRIDYAANIAGIGAIKGPIAEGKTANWNKMIAVNLTGVWLCAKEEILQMAKQEPRESPR
jgi:NAD(P)-dependent dehydrogenase (short-subunit alcohol dehydrogenase family)